jgi:hypothetical protein
MSTSSNRLGGRWHPASSLVIIASIALLLYADQSSRLDPGGTSVFVSAQNVAGKFATRAKLTTKTSTKKKKRWFGGNRRVEEVAANEDAARDGEFDGSSLWRRLRSVFDGDDSTSSLEWDLFLAESRMILVSVIVSVLCALVPFAWYSMPGKGIPSTHDGEEGGGEFDVPPLHPLPLHTV